MKLVLLKDIPKIGEIDSIINAKDGYARNYLLPQKLAVVATPKVLAGVEERKASREKEREEKKSHFEEIAKKLAETEVTIIADVGDEGRLFGSVNAPDIVDAIKAATGLEIDKRKIDMLEPIKVIGEYQVSIKLLRDVAAEIKVKVVAKI
ncbi:MAG: 50S ribosomal protein L9 [bacterium]